MEKLLANLRDIKGVKAVKKRSGPTLKIKLYSKEIPDTEAGKIMGDLRSISQQISNTLTESKEKREINAWNWIQKPEKKYRKTSVKTEKVTDRKATGHEPTYYTASIQK